VNTNLHCLLLLHPLLTDLQGKLEEVYETFAPSAADPSSSSSSGAAKELQQLALLYSLPQELVEKVGAPPTMWTIIRWVTGRAMCDVAAPAAVAAAAAAAS
jgi:hypothetical protein